MKKLYILIIAILSLQATNVAAVGLAIPAACYHTDTITGSRAYLGHKPGPSTKSCTELFKDSDEFIKNHATGVLTQENGSEVLDLHFLTHKVGEPHCIIEQEDGNPDF